MINHLPTVPDVSSARSDMSAYLMFLLQVLHSREALAVVWGIGKWLVLLDPLQLSLHVAVELLESERVFQLLPAFGRRLE